MGRHSRQTSAGHVRSTALRTAAALGVAGTIAVVFHASSGDDGTARTRTDVTAQDRGPDLPASPAGSPAEPGSPHSGGLSPSSSASPRTVADDPGTGSLRGGAAAAATPDSRPGGAREHAAATGRKADGTGRKPGGPAPGGSPSGAGSAPASARTDTAPEPRAAGPADGTSGSTGGASRDDGTALSGTVEGVTGVLGGLTGNLTGGLGWGGNGLPTG
ncbi:hypothetical protein ACH437_24565 [Streptomyces xinghaiensis]|uniref:hypothetical protein n=1 Tax=Streptomyces xinghaiensis TaxID=1038928 RepID=UPI003795210E